MARPAIIAVGLSSLLATSGLATSPPPQPDRQAELVHRLKHDCGSCHGMTMKGGLGPALLPAKLAEKSDGFLAEVILNGVPGTPMPPWNGEITLPEAQWLVDFLRKGETP